MEKLYELYSTEKPDEQHLKKIEHAQYKLLEEIANSLGYKDKITWKTIQNPYIPKGLMTQLREQQNSKQTYNQLLSSMIMMMANNTKEPMSSQTDQ